MTDEGLLYAINRYDLRGFLIEPASIDPYLQRSAIQAGPNAMMQFGPLWQQLMDVLPELADGVAVEGTPALHCWVWPADRVEDCVRRLAALDAGVFSQRVQALQARGAAGGGHALDQLETMRQLVRLQAELRAFLNAAAGRRDAVLLYVV
ncbi:hypothetical protein HNP33_003593 [Comamonas odontotermitis]|uniref:DUF1877 family protein n=1 Tax=Comamonas odontotermitis TaxID=379895 RepID=A0ABR6RJW7_9BURK|nr:hypothetical protein [Comamonas odontotermitis]MBB6579480.1 hypothetical protein [Comamonas odontotermitis]